MKPTDKLTMVFFICIAVVTTVAIVSDAYIKTHKPKMEEKR